MTPAEISPPIERVKEGWAGGCVFVFALLLGVVTVGYYAFPDKGPWHAISSSGKPAPKEIDPNPEYTTNLGPTASVVVGHGLVNAPFVAMLVTAVAMALLHRRRARAEAVFHLEAPLREGAAVVFGEVELPAGHTGPAIEVRIAQRGSEYSGKGHTSHQWKEVRRTLLASPFYLRCQDGTRVRVEPDAQVALHDDLGEIQREGPEERTRWALVEAGDRVHVTGELRGAGSAPGGRGGVYRERGEGPVLGPPRLGRMVVSTERPGDAESKRSRFHRRWTLGLAAALAVVAGGVAPSFEILSLDGKPVMAEVTALRDWRVWVKPKNGPGHWVTSYAVQARTPGRDGLFVTLEDDCRAALSACVARGECPYAPFVVSERFPTVHQVGARPTLGLGTGIVLVLAVLILGTVYRVGTVSVRPWYAKRKVDDHGQGGLSASEPRYLGPPAG